MVKIPNPLPERAVGDKVVIANIWKGIGKDVFKDGVSESTKDSKGKKGSEKERILPKFLRFVKMLEVDGTKLEFTYRENDYVLDPEYIDKFDIKNRPIIDFVLGHAKPIHLRIQKVPEDDDSSAFHTVYTKRQLAAVLASATKLVAETKPWIYILAGFGMGVMAGLILVHFGIFGQVYTAPPPTTGASIG